MSRISKLFAAIGIAIGACFVLAGRGSVAFAQSTLSPSSMSPSSEHPSSESPFDEREWRVGEQMRRDAITRQAESHLTPDEMLESWRAMKGVGKGEKSLGSSIHYSWEFLGPENQSGRVQTLVAIPGSGELLAGAAGGGVWRFGRDSLWTVKSDTFPSLKITASTFDPEDPATIAMGTGEGFVYLSSDSGYTWRVALKSPGSNIMSMTFHPKKKHILYAATDDGLFMTTNLGTSWKNIAPGRARSVFVNPLNTAIIYYGQMDWTWPNSLESVMKSTDSGKTFTKMFSQPEGYWSDVLLGMCKAHPDVLWLGTDSARIYFRSSDAGASWHQCAATPVLDSYNAGFWCFAADPTDPNTALAGGPALFRTMDGGASWIRVDKDVHPDFHTFAFPGGSRAALGCDGGVYITDNYRADTVLWRYQSTGLITLQAYDVAGDPSGEDIVITGNQDNGYAKFTADRSNWRIVGGDGFVTIYNPQKPLLFYHEYVDMNLHRATDGFTWWSEKVMNGLPTTTDFYTGIVSDPVDWYGQAVTIDPNDPNVLYCGTDSLYRTTDQGNSWLLAASRSFTRGSFISAIAISQVDSNVLYVGSNDGVLTFSHNHGTTWDTVAQSQFANQQGRIYSIACDPADKSIAYLSMQLGANGTPLYRTTNEGLTWQKITTGLPQTTTSRIVVDPKRPTDLYVGATTGVCYSPDRGASWQLLSGLPNVQVIDLAWQNLGPTNEQCLLIGTYGRGIIRGHVGAVYTTLSQVAFPRTRVNKFRDSTVQLFIANTGIEAMNVLKLEVGGVDSSFFSVLSGGGQFSLQPNASHAVTLRFLPMAMKHCNASVIMHLSDGTSPTICKLSGEGTIPMLTTDGVTVLNFGTLSPGVMASRSLTLKGLNFADLFDTLRVRPITISGSDSANFSFVPTQGVALDSLDPRSTEVVTFTCTTTAAGPITAWLIMGTDGVPALDSIKLIANGVSGVPAIASSVDVELTCTPNPATNEITVAITAPKPIAAKSWSIELVDAAGRIVRTVNGAARLEGTLVVPFETENLASGSYLVRLSIGSEMFSARVVIAR